jgi:2-keto-4-pentenoate hydratase/2-oxohepta-3-ene-1,7-dioic acid hydratase in catechol pathway
VRLATASHAGRLVFGPVVDDRLHDVAGSHWPDPIAMLDAERRDALAADAASAVSFALDELELLPPIPRPRRILCVGVNYAEHAAESDRPAEGRAHPVVFTRFASSLVGHRSPVVRPTASTQFDYEGELAVVIGRRTRAARASSALDAIAGFACFMDGTLRDFQRHSSQFTPGKNFDRSGAFGPWIVTTDEVGDGSGLRLTTTLNGSVVQQASTDQLIHGIAELIAYCSTFTTLEPGDVIATGTPGGVGFARDPQLWLTPGDEVAVSIDRVGTLVNPVADESATS